MQGADTDRLDSPTAALCVRCVTDSATADEPPLDQASSIAAVCAALDSPTAPSLRLSGPGEISCEFFDPRAPFAPSPTSSSGIVASYFDAPYPCTRVSADDALSLFATSKLVVLDSAAPIFDVRYARSAAPQLSALLAAPLVHDCGALLHASGTLVASRAHGLVYSPRGINVRFIAMCAILQCDVGLFV